MVLRAEQVVGHKISLSARRVNSAPARLLGATRRPAPSAIQRGRLGPGRDRAPEQRFRSLRGSNRSVPAELAAAGYDALHCSKSPVRPSGWHEHGHRRGGRSLPGAQLAGNGHERASSSASPPDPVTHGRSNVSDRCPCTRWSSRGSSTGSWSEPGAAMQSSPGSGSGKLGAGSLISMPGRTSPRRLVLHLAFVTPCYDMQRVAQRGTPLCLCCPQFQSIANRNLVRATYGRP
jgi:hypothetical protein